MQQIQEVEVVEEIDETEGFVSEEEYRRVRTLAENRFNFIRRLIDIAYTHKNDPKLFSKNFIGAVQPKELFKHNVIDLTESSPLFENMTLNRNEFELMLMRGYGFKARELCLICNHRSTNSVYAILSKIRKKLASDDKGAE